ncbi:O-antigen ligase family protein [Desulfococcaceae bacterium HSG9]|nr:O-antigen ligase family protein [Desulfococcaceae bacterium HSG9]
MASIKNEIASPIILIGGAIGIIPFLYSGSTIDPVLLPRFIALAALTFVLILMLSMRIAGQLFHHGTRLSDSFSIIFRVVFPVSVAYLAVAALSLIKAVNPAEGLFEWLKLLIAFAFFYTASLIVNRHKDNISYLVRSITVLGAVLGIIGVCQYFRLGFQFIPGNFEMYATLAHRNMLASALVLILPFAVYSVKRFNGLWRFISFVSTVVILFCLGAARTRSAWAALIVATLVTVIAFSITRTKAKRPMQTGRRFGIKHIVILLIAITILSAALLTRHPYQYATPLHSLESLQERFCLWEKTLRMVRDAPILGVGVGQWRIMLPRYGKIEKWLNDRPSEAPAEVVFQRPHNDYLWILAETGSAGLICYLMFLSLLYIYIGRILVYCADINIHNLAFLLLFALTGYVIIAFFSFPKERIVHTIISMLIAACIVAIYHLTFPVAKTPSFGILIPINGILLLGLILSMTVGCERYLAESHAGNALTARNTGQWEKVIAAIDLADSRFYNMDPVSTPLAWYRGIARFSLNRIEPALHDFKTAVAVHPYHIHALNNLATCYALTGDYQKAVLYYEKALTIAPRFKDALTNLEAVRVYTKQPAMDTEKQ